MMISFIVPALNEETLIGACVDSIVDEIHAAQVRGEIIVVDNGSTDDTRDVAMRHGARVVMEQRRGITFARQAGLDAATGDFVANVDADSLVPAGWIDAALRELKNPKVVAVSGPLHLTEVSRLVGVLSLAFYIIGYLTYKVTGVMLQGGNAVIKRSALLQIGGYDTTIDFHGEDTDTAVKLARLGRIAWTWRLSMRSSGRRLSSEGAFVTGVRYATNYISVIVSGRPATRTHHDIRH